MCSAFRSPLHTCFTSSSGQRGCFLPTSSAVSCFLSIVESLSSSAPRHMYLPHLAQATQVAPVTSDERGSSAPFYEHSPFNLSGSKIRQELLSPDVFLCGGLALCSFPSSSVDEHIPTITRVLMFGSKSTESEPGSLWGWRLCGELKWLHMLEYVSKIDLITKCIISRKVIISA